MLDSASLLRLIYLIVVFKAGFYRRRCLMRQKDDDINKYRCEVHVPGRTEAIHIHVFKGPMLCKISDVFQEQSVPPACQ